jgi:HK97 family phage major capsid protein
MPKITMEQEAFDSALAQAKAQGLAEARSTGAPNFIVGGGTGKSNSASPYAAFTDNVKGLPFARFTRCLAAARGDLREAKSIAEKWAKKSRLEVDTLIAKAMTETSFDDGGALVFEQFSSEVVELLRGTSVVRRAGARVIPMPKGNISMPKLVGGAVSYFIGESENARPSGIKTSRLSMSAKKQMGIVPISNDLLEDDGPQADVIVRDDLVAAVGEREELAFLRSDGSENTPTGIRYLVDSEHVIQPLGSTLDNVRATLSKAIRLLKTAKIPMVKPAWIITPRTEEFLMNLSDGNGNLVFDKDMAESEKLRRIPFFVSNLLPEDLGAGGNETEIYLVDWAQFLIGETGSMSVKVFENGTYYDPSIGAVVSGVSRDETVIQTRSRVDCGLRHDKAAVVIDQVTWGDN